ncbi:hypothetical protein C8F01DRAFT_1079682 [Mycena amicta]|nr:hypothetical protein C8F01DRAFT_1079682 [Mycena amicta]
MRAYPHPSNFHASPGVSTTRWPASTRYYETLGTRRRTSTCPGMFIHVSVATASNLLSSPASTLVNNIGLIVNPKDSSGRNHNGWHFWGLVPPYSRSSPILGEGYSTVSCGGYPDSGECLPASLVSDNCALVLPGPLPPLDLVGEFKAGYLIPCIPRATPAQLWTRTSDLPESAIPCSNPALPQSNRFETVVVLRWSRLPLPPRRLPLRQQNSLCTFDVNVQYPRTELPRLPERWLALPEEERKLSSKETKATQRREVDARVVLGGPGDRDGTGSQDEQNTTFGGIVKPNTFRYHDTELCGGIMRRQHSSKAVRPEGRICQTRRNRMRPPYHLSENHAIRPGTSWVSSSSGLVAGARPSTSASDFRHTVDWHDTAGECVDDDESNPRSHRQYGFAWEM